MEEAKRMNKKNIGKELKRAAPWGGPRFRTSRSLK